jgi:hypothetical protein
MDSARFTGLALDPAVVDSLERILPRMAERTVAAITAEVPAYTDAFSGRMGQNIENAVQTSLGAFLRLATRAEDSDPGPPLSPARDGAYDLGRGEARNGRSIDALLSAYRVGARVAWRELSTTAVAAGLPAATVAWFAELVFAFIDELSASSASGHADELASAGRVRQRYLDYLTRQLLTGEPAEALSASAERATWTAPEVLTAVLLPQSHLRGVATILSPDAGGSRRAALLAALAGRHAVVGPSRPWLLAQSSYLRAIRARHLPADDRALVDTDEHLVELVLTADQDAAADLRRRALAPLAALGPSAEERLTETLRSWLLNQGRRDAMAAELFVHPQTVRYRMNQIREAYGDELSNPATILELTVALGTPSQAAARGDHPAS